MENQHRKIKGYRELNQEEIDLMNEVKEAGENLQLLIDKVNQVNASSDDEDFGNLVLQSEAFRWSALAKTHLQEGIMALTRAVAKPDFF